MLIGDVLKRLRVIYGYKASEMSKMLNISPSYLSEIENGKKQPSLEHLRKYAEMSESYEEAEKDGKGAAMIRTMMISLITGMSKAPGERYESE